MKGKDHTGQKFHMLTVLGEAEKHPSITHRRVVCKCECGSVKTYNLPSLVAGRAGSCGCMSATKASQKLARERDPIRRIPTHLEVEQLIAYSPSKGTLHWRNRPEQFSPSKAANEMWNASWAGKEIKALDLKGYVTVSIFGRQIRAHRLIYFMVVGVWPDCQIDHINGIKSDNRWSNLRPASRRENQRNTRKPRNNTSGFKGVVFDKANKKWYFQLRMDDGSRFTKTGFKTREDAAAACRVKREEIHGEFANHG